MDIVERCRDNAERGRYVGSDYIAAAAEIERLRAAASIAWTALADIRDYVDGRRAPFNSGAPIALIAYGAQNMDALQRSRLGFVVVSSNVADATRKETHEPI